MEPVGVATIRPSQETVPASMPFTFTVIDTTPENFFLYKTASLRQSLAAQPFTLHESIMHLSVRYCSLSIASSASDMPSTSISLRNPMRPKFMPSMGMSCSAAYPAA